MDRATNCRKGGGCVIAGEMIAEQVSTEPIRSSRPESRQFAAQLIAVGTAVPDLKWDQPQMARMLAQTWNLRGADLDRWQRIVAGSGIDTRHGVRPLNETIHLTTAQRMSEYESFAGPLAEKAARRAMRAAGVSAVMITDLIVVSCTGFSAPGLDVDLIARLDLPRNVRRTMVGFMGCYGAICGLRTAVGACAAGQDRCALVVCAELCSLHARADADVQNQVASALFGDGAAAAVVRSCDQREASHEDQLPNALSAPGIGFLTSGETELIDGGREMMTWRATDHGFSMTLAREVPVMVRRSLAEFVNRASDGARPRSFVVHPGGPGILEAVDAALELDGGCGLQAAREVLRRVGNVSSGTVLFVLEEMLRTRLELPAMLLAFGPGLTIESLMLH